MLDSLYETARTARGAHDYTASAPLRPAVVGSQPIEGRSDAGCPEVGKAIEEFENAAIGDDRKNASGGDGQGCSPALGFQRGRNQLPRFAFAAAATRGAAGTGLHVFERARAARDGAADVMIGDGLADADVHGLFEWVSMGAI